MRVLHIVKTSSGADWAAAQAAVLVRLGVEVHVALPSAEGRTMPAWRASGAQLHVVPTCLPVTRPWLLPSFAERLRGAVAAIEPDLIHSHFVGSTLLLRQALGRRHPVPRLFQVPGPLHLEHRLYRSLDIRTASASDYWIASSRYIRRLYQDGGVPMNRVYLSYHGIDLAGSSWRRTGLLRAKYGIPAGARIIGNFNFIYPPKYYLGQTRGLKAHEDVIDVIGEVLRRRPDVYGFLGGGAANGGGWYERQLRRRAESVGRGRILMPGYLPVDEVRALWPDLDIALHMPFSENCGGVGEPMLAGVPTVAAPVGGLPELVIDGVTGTLLPSRGVPEAIAAVLQVLDDYPRHREMAAAGQRMVTRMVDVERTAAEVLEIYRHALGLGDAPPEFDPAEARHEALHESMELTV